LKKIYILIFGHDKNFDFYFDAYQLYEKDIKRVNVNIMCVFDFFIKTPISTKYLNIVKNKNRKKFIDELLA
jgi:hypothetical protein